MTPQLALLCECGAAADPDLGQCAACWAQDMTEAPVETEALAKLSLPERCREQA